MPQVHQLSPSALNTKQLCQLWQAHLELQDMHLEAAGLHGDLHTATRQAWMGRQETFLGASGGGGVCVGV